MVIMVITPLAVSGLPVLEFAEQGRDLPNPNASKAILAAAGPRLWVYEPRWATQTHRGCPTDVILRCNCASYTL
jgi:hypothetical protein